MASPNIRKENIGKNSEQETRSAVEHQTEQEPFETETGSLRKQSSDEARISQTKCVSNTRYLSANLTTIDDEKANLTNNRSPSPISPEFSSENDHQKPNQELVLEVSQANIPPNNEKHRESIGTKSVITGGGRVIRNIKENTSVKYNIDAAFKQYPSEFSSYKNVFRPGSVKESEHGPSLRRDGTKRHTSSRERVNSKTSSSNPSDDVFVNDRKITPNLYHQESTDSCKSVTSNTQLITNPYNDFNHKISSIIWCSCFFFFFFGCCLPGVLFMSRSDTLFAEGDYKKARIYAIVSSVSYIIGLILSIAFWSGIFAVIIIFNT